MNGIGGLRGGGRLLGRGGGGREGEGHQDSQGIFLISYTMQHAIVEMALVRGNSACSYC